MKKLYLSILVLFSCFLVGCSLDSPKVKWSYSLLPNDYELQYLSDETFQLGKLTDGNISLEENKVAIGIKGNITGFTTYESRYIYIEIEEKLKEYYVVDSKEETVYGPLNEEEMDYKLTALGITYRNTLIDTSTVLDEK